MRGHHERLRSASPTEREYTIDNLVGIPPVIGVRSLHQTTTRRGSSDSARSPSYSLLPSYDETLADVKSLVSGQFSATPERHRLALEFEKGFRRFSRDYSATDEEARAYIERFLWKYGISY